MQKQTTLWIIVEDNKILLCMKKRWFWAWLYNWAWWKLENWETLVEGMIRELEEETTLKTKQEDIINHWVLHFFFEENWDWDQDVNIFIIKDYEWIPQETEEMKPEWFDIDKIPYEEMWEDDYIWLPEVLNWEKVEYNFWFWKDWKMKKYEKIK